MLSYNNNDFNVKNIVDATGFLDADLKKDYRVHGLSEENKFDLIIFTKKVDEKAEKLVDFFRNNGFNTHWDTSDKYTANIGIHRKFRDDIKLSVKIIKTIILYLENKLIFNPNYKIKR